MMSVTSKLHVIRIAWFICSIFLVAFPGSLYAQTLTDKFGGFSKTSNEPIHIEADELVVNDVKKTAVFSGNVKAVQGDFVLRSKVLEVFYSGSPQGAGAKKGAGKKGAAPSSKVNRLVAKIKVLISTKDNQSATSEWADFDVAKQVILLGDQVVLTQGGNIIKGGRLHIDLKTRRSRFINKRNNKRVQMKVDVKSGKKLKLQ